MSKFLNKSAERPQKIRPLLLFHVNVHSFSYLALTYLSFYEPQILTQKGGTLLIFPYMLIQNPCAESAERQSSSYLHVQYWRVASDVKKVVLAYLF